MGGGYKRIPEGAPGLEAAPPRSSSAAFQMPQHLASRAAPTLHRSSAELLPVTPPEIPGSVICNWHRGDILIGRLHQKSPIRQIMTNTNSRDCRVKHRSRSTKPLVIDDRVETAGHLVVRTQIFLDIWDFYSGPSRAGILETMNHFSEFFRFDEHAHRTSFIVHAAALFENKPNTINLCQLAKELHNASRITDNSMSDIQQQFICLKKIIEGLFIIRSNALAHRSDTISLNNAFDRAEISMNDLRELMNAALRIVNILLVACSRKQQVFFTLPLEDVRGLLANLANHSA